MILDSLAAVISFLLLVAPGIVWSLQQARYEPAVKESTLVELSRVVLASLVATSLAGAIMLPFAWIPLYESLGTNENALTSSKALIPFVGAALATCATACGLVLIAAAIRWRDRAAPISKVRVWHRAFVQWKPKDSGPPFLIVRMKDGTVWRGSLKAFDSDPEDDHRTIAIGAPLSRMQPPDSHSFNFYRLKKQNGPTPKVLSGDQVVLLAEGDIESVQVKYPRLSK